jgi:hypothetical protein
MAFSPDGTRLAIASGKEARIVAVGKGQDSRREVARVVHDELVTAVIFSPNDGTRLATAAVKKRGSRRRERPVASLSISLRQRRSARTASISPPRATTRCISWTPPSTTCSTRSAPAMAAICQTTSGAGTSVTVPASRPAKSGQPRRIDLIFHNFLQASFCSPRLRGAAAISQSYRSSMLPSCSRHACSSAATSRRRAMASAVQRPCFRAFWLPSCPPIPSAPPCIRHRLRPPTAGC